MFEFEKKVTGVLIFDDEHNLVGVASEDEEVIYCRHCGGNFPVDKDRVKNVHFCGWCGARLGDE